MGSRKTICGLAGVTLAGVLLAGCNLQLFQSIRITGTPTMHLDGGTVHQRVSDIDFIAQLESQLGSAFDSGSRVAADPYTYRGTVAPFSVDVSTFFTDAGVNELFDFGTVGFTSFDPADIAIPPPAPSSIPLTTGTGSEALPALQATVPTVTGFVQAEVGDGALSLSIGDATTDPLPPGDYTLSVAVTSPEDPAFSADFGPTLYTDPDPAEIVVDISLAGLAIQSGSTVEVDVTLSWNITGPPTTVPVDSSFALVEFSQLVIDIGTDPFSGVTIDPIAIPEDLRRDVESVAVDTATSEIRLNVTADLLTDLSFTLESNALFDTGTSGPQTIVAGTTTPQQLVFPITANELTLLDPDNPGPGIDAIDVNVQTDLIGHNTDTGELTLTNVRTDSTIPSSVTATAQVAVDATSVTLRDIGSLLSDNAFALESDTLAPIADAPDWLYFVTVPGRIELAGTIDPADSPAIILTATAFDQGGVPRASVEFPPAVIGAGPVEADLAPLLNARPDRIEFQAATSGGGSLTLGPADVLEVVLELDVVLDIQVLPAEGDQVDLLSVFFTDGSFTMESDALGRSGVDDLSDILDNAKGAELEIDFLQNTTGLPAMGFRIDGNSAAGPWLVAEGQVGSGTAMVTLSDDDVARIRDTYPFTPTFRLFLPRTEGDESYALNYNGEIGATVRLELAADIDYTFDLFSEADQ